MKNKNKNTLKIFGIITGSAILIYLIMRFTKKNKTISGVTKPILNNNDKNDPQKVFKSLESEFKNDPDKLQLLNTAERILRLESNHFKSNIYKNTLGGAFLAFTKTYPFGFVAPVPIWEKYGKPTDFYSSSNGLDYIKFPNLEVGVRSVIALLQGYYRDGYTTGRYHGGDPQYVEKLNSFDDSKLFTESYDSNKYLIS